MSSIVRLTRRFVGILCLSILLLLAVNVVILIVIAANQTPGAGPSLTAPTSTPANILFRLSSIPNE